MLIVCITSLIYCRIEVEDWGEILSFTSILIFILMIICIIPANIITEEMDFNKSYILKDTSKLVKIKNGHSISASASGFIFLSASINSSKEYVVFVKNDDGSIVQKALIAYHTKLIETDSRHPCIEKYYSINIVNGFVKWWMLPPSETFSHYEVYIPKGSVVHSYEL